MIDLEHDLTWIGRELERPECVLATADGALFTADWRGGIAQTRPGAADSVLISPASAFKPALKPNGIALDGRGAFLLAHLGDEGGIWRLRKDGRVEPFLTEVEGEKIPPANFVWVDSRRRIWITVSTRLQPRQWAYRQDVSDGFIVLADDHGARVVADGLGFANEVRLDPREEWLYVNETFARRISRFRVGRTAELSDREVVATFGHGVYPDGLTWDAEGGLWITSIVSNRVIRLAPDGTQQLILEDADPDHVEWVEEAYRANRLDRPHLDTIRSRYLKNISSLAFGGPDLRTVYLGCLLGSQIASFRSPVAGLAPPYWHWSV